MNTRLRIGGARLAIARGFTLIELLVVLVIASILFGYAVPGMRVYIQNGRIVTYTNELIADLNLARSEAVKRAGRVVICKSANPEAAVPTCTTAGNWTTGRLVFVDAGVGVPPVYNNAYNPADNDVILRVRNSIEFADGTMTATQNPSGVQVNFITFTKLGMTTIAAAEQAAFSVCDERLTANGRLISVNAVGRTMLGRPNAC